MQAPGIRIGAGESTYGLGWQTKMLGGVPVIAHSGDHPNAHTLIFIEPASRRGAVLLMNSQNMLAQFGAFSEIQEGVARLLAGREPRATTTLRLPTLYLIIDAVLGILFVLALWPLLRRRRWEQRLQQQQTAGALRLRWVRLRLAWEIGLPLTLLVGVRLLLHALGAQSWAEGLLLFPDFGAGLWAFSLLMLLTGALHLIGLRRVVQRNDNAHPGRVHSTFLGEPGQTTYVQ